jgi:hypothetical protein
MPECDYCDAAFEDEQSHLEHVHEDHEGELGAIDRRRVEAAVTSDDDGGLPTGPIVLGVVIGISVLIGGYVIFVGGSGSEGAVNGISVERTPGQVFESAHGHETVSSTVEGEPVDPGSYELQGTSVDNAAEGDTIASS